MLKTEAIVLRTVKYGETSLIVDVYTREEGKITLVANGVRKAKTSMPASLFQLGSQLHIIVYFKPGKDIHRLKEAQLVVHYQRIPFDLVRGNLAFFMCELLSKTIRETIGNAEIYDFCTDYLEQLDQSSSIAHIPAHFMIHLKEIIGFGLFNGYTHDTPYFNLRSGHFEADMPVHGQFMAEEVGALYYELHCCELQDISEKKSAREIRFSLIDDIITFFELHIDRFTRPDSYTILRDLWN